MAKYLDLSTIPPSVSTTIDPDFGVALDYSASGVLHKRGLYAGTFYAISMSWDLLKLEQRDRLETFFVMAKLEPITFTLDGHDYTTELVSGPVRRYVSGTLYGLSVTLRGTRVHAADPIAALFARLGAVGFWLDPLALSSVWADTAGVTAAALNGAVARIDAAGGMPARFWTDTTANRPLLRSDGLEFDGSNDVLTYIDDPALRLGTTSFTIAIAVLPDVVTGDHGLLTKRGTGAAGSNPGWGLRQSAASIALEYDYTGNATATYTIATDVLSVATWTTAMVEIDVAAEEATARINTIVQAPVAITAGDISGTQALTLGGLSGLFDGKLGRAVVIDKILSDADKQIVEQWITAGHG